MSWPHRGLRALDVALVALDVLAYAAHGAGLALALLGLVCALAVGAHGMAAFWAVCAMSFSIGLFAG